MKFNINDLEIDILFNHTKNVRDTYLINLYSRGKAFANYNFFFKSVFNSTHEFLFLVDWRVRPLGLILKHWATVNKISSPINDKGNLLLPNYALLLMLINYLQGRAKSC